MATLMDGRALAAKVRAEVAEAVRGLGGARLATVLVGDDPASQIYIRLKHAAAAEVGITPLDTRLEASATQEAVLRTVAELNRDPSVDGILVQTPLPSQIDEHTVMRALDPLKDVDGLHPFNAGQLYLGRPTLIPATPLGVMRMLSEYGFPVAGSQAVVVGRSAIVGRPMAMLLVQGNATVSICHSRTRDLAAYTSAADIVVAAAGRPGLVTPDMVKSGAAVVDVGLTRTDNGLLGDVADGVEERAGFLTPVPGGVGPMTIATLLGNTVTAARYRRGDLAFPGM